MKQFISPYKPTEQQMQELADFYTVFSDSTRVKLLYHMLDGEKRVGDLALAAGISQSATSHQLRFLKEKGVVDSRRAGQSIFYRLIDDHIVTILAMGLEHVLEPGNEHHMNPHI